MDTISREIQVPVTPDKAFHFFVNDIHQWWPKEYTWSQQQLQNISIEGKRDGLCTETGPYGFRCDWGRVTDIAKNKMIRFTWQISPDRVPEPDPDKSSIIKISFTAAGDSAAVVAFGHSHFEQHGEGADKYRKAMDSKEGWDYILGRYQVYCSYQ